MTMTCTRIMRLITLLLLVVGLSVETGRAQTASLYGRAYLPAPYGSSLPGYPSANHFNRTRAYPGVPRGPQTITDYRPLIRAITSLPGWNTAPRASQRTARNSPSLSKSDLLAADGAILWPGTTASDTRLLPARKDAEQAVALVVREQATYGQATIRHVADARNKLTELARQSLPSLKARDRDAATQLERFIVELQKSLATMTAHY
jgi:hypothetical protein